MNKQEKELFLSEPMDFKLEDMYAFCGLEGGFLNNIMAILNEMEPSNKTEMKNKSITTIRLYQDIFKKLITDSSLSPVDKDLMYRVLDTLVSPMYDSVNNY